MANGMEMRKINRNFVYRTLLGKGTMSKLEISRQTELSLPTVAQNLEQLIQEGLVETSGSLESTGGRRAAGFQSVNGAWYAVGIDITQNHMRIVIVNVAGELVYEMDRERFQFRNEDACYDLLAERVFRVLDEESIDHERVLGIGISLPCIVDRAENRITYSRIIDAPEDFAVQLSHRLPFRIELFNDANSAGYAEFFETNWQESPDGFTFYLMLSNSVGGAIMGQSGTYLGENSRSAEVGHMRIVPGGNPCYCGQCGCVNAYCSAKRLSDRTDGELAAFFDGLKAGNPEYRQAFDEYLNYLALTVINLRMLYDSNIILGGYVGAYLEGYIDELREVTARLDPYSDTAEYLKPCTFRHDASAIGAALNFIGEFIEAL